MSKVVALACYSTKNFRKSQELLLKSAKSVGINRIFAFTEKDLFVTQFYRKHKTILDQKHGAGFFLWKPYFVLEALKQIDTGDILFYADSGIQIIRDLKPLIKIAEKKEIVLFSNDEHLNREYTKRDCFILMKCDSEKYWGAKQIQASFFVLKKTRRSVKFIEEWLKYSQNKNIITNIPSEFGEELSGFIAHRQDQPILSLLATKHGIEIFRDPSQWGNYSKMKAFRVFLEFLHRPYSKKPFLNSPYNQLLYQHRNNLLRSKVLGKIGFLDCAWQKIINLTGNLLASK